jgi:hypothetical protein
MMESLHVALEVAKENQPKVASMQLNGKAIQWKDVQECEKKLRKDEYASRAHLLVAMYSLIPPRRLGDYQNMEVFKNKTEFDAATGIKMLINTRNKYADMSISEYKTSGIYETNETRIQGVLFTIIKTNLAAEKRRFLFEHTLGAAYVSATFSKAVTDVFKRKLGASLGINSLRHLKITAFIATNPNLHAREELARQMGNSVEMQQLYNISTDPKQEAIKKARIKVILADVSRLRSEIDKLNDELIELLT